MSQILRLHIRGHEDQQPALLDLATFLWDVNLLYQTSVLGAAVEYENVRVSFSSPWYYSRSSSKLLRLQHRLRIEHVRHESPLDLSTIVPLTGAAIAGLLGIATVLEKAAKARLERRKLLLEIEKLEREKRADERKLRDDMPLLQDESEFRRRIQKHEAEAAYEHIAKRVENAKGADPFRQRKAA
jgi:hypothetical protein